MAEPWTHHTAQVNGFRMHYVVAGAGYGSKPDERDGFKRDSATIVEKFEREGMEKVADTYAIGPTRVQFQDKDPVGWKEFYDLLKKQSARGHALTMRGVQMQRPFPSSAWYELPIEPAHRY